MTNKTIERAMTDLHRVAEKIKSDAPAEVTLGERDGIRQGDIYIWRVSKLPAMPDLRARKSRQLADGTTQGSRHVLVGDCQVFDFRRLGAGRDLLAREYPGCDLRDYQIGPAIRTNQDVTIEHPEHGHRTLAGEGCYVVTYQRSLDADGREERARD